MTDKRQAGVAGSAAVGVSLGVGELLAGLFNSIPSVISSIGAWIVDWSPPALEDFAIRVFGTSDKLALGIGTVVIALVIGWFAGRAAVARFGVAVVVFSVFGIIGLVASFGQPFYAPIPVALATVASVGVGLSMLRMLLAAADTTKTPTDGIADNEPRRRFLVLAGASVAAASVAGVAGRALLGRVPAGPAIDLPTVTTRPDAGLIADGHELGVPGLTRVVVPNEDFYRIDTALVVPRVDVASWTMGITGMVERDVTLDYETLLGMDHVDRYVTIACVSNEVGGNLVGNAQWTGPLLSEVLEMAGVRPDATQLVGRSVDSWTAGFPTEMAFDDREAMIALFMNGEPLPRPHGFPARLIVPGLYGYVSATKWLAEIRLTRWEDFDAYWVPRGWSKEGPIKLQSRIDTPRNGASATGDLVAAGVAWAPTVGVSGVEVSIDDGPWQATELSVPLSDAAWVQWKATLATSPGQHEIAVRAIDTTGMVQTDARTSPRPNGATGHHRVRFSVG